MLIKASPGINRGNGRAWLAWEDVAFNQSFHGFSGAGNEAGEDLVRYLQLVAHSDLWMHHALLTSPKLGAERRVIYKEDLEGFPIIPWSRLTAEHQNTAKTLSGRLLKEDAEAFAEIDAFIATLCRLRQRDVEVIRDTLSVELPFKSVRSKASSPPMVKQRNVFCTRLGGGFSRQVNRRSR